MLASELCFPASGAGHACSHQQRASGAGPSRQPHQRLADCRRQQPAHGPRSHACRLLASRSFHFEVDINEGEDVDRAIYTFTNFERQTKVLEESRRRRYFESQSDFRKRMESAKFTTIRRAREEAFVKPYSEHYEEESTPFDEMYKEASVFGGEYPNPMSSFDADQGAFTGGSFAQGGVKFGVDDADRGSLMRSAAAQQASIFKLSESNPVMNSVMGWEVKNRGALYPKSVKKAMVSNPEANKLKDPFATPQPSRKPDLRPSSSPAAPQRGPATAGARQAADGRKMSQNPKKQPKGRSGKKSKK